MGALPRDPSPLLPAFPASQETAPPLQDPHPLPQAPVSMEMALEEGYTQRRTPQVLFKVVKDFMKNNYQAVEREFCDLDEMNTERLSQETMYQLFKR